MKSNLQLLAEIYQLDLNHFMNNELKGTNFLENYSIFKEMLPIIVEKSGNDRNILEKISDRILEFCVEKIFVVESQKSEIILSYMKDCRPLASSQMTRNLFSVFLHYFILVSSGKENVHISFEVPDFVSKLFQTNKNLFCPIGDFDAEKIDLLNSYLSLIGEDSKVFDLVDVSLVEFLVNLAHQVLIEAEQSSNLTKLAINCLCKIASSGESWRKLVLSKTFSNLKTAVSAENYFEPQLGKSQKNEKKRLETYFEDKNLNLVTSLAEFFMEQGKEEVSYLEQTEFWYLVQIGLVHTNALTRKRALYLLKRTCDLASQSSSEIRSILFDYNGDKKTFLFEAKWSAWNDFFLCIELLEETSVIVALLVKL